MHEKEDSTVACMYLFWRFVAARGQRDQHGSPGRRAEQRATVAAAAQLAEFALRPVLILLQVMTSMKMLCSYFSSFSPPLSPCAPPFTPPPRARSLTQRRSPKTLNTNTPHTLLAVFPFACAMSPQGPRTCVNRVTPPPPVASCHRWSSASCVLEPPPARRPASCAHHTTDRHGTSRTPQQQQKINST